MYVQKNLNILNALIISGVTEIFIEQNIEQKLNRMAKTLNKLKYMEDKTC